MRTEQISLRYLELDSWPTDEMLVAMYEGQLAAAAAVRSALSAIAAAVEDAVPALQRGGRLVYAGAGTSGRIGVQDGTELPPTFDWPSDRLVFAMAGGLDGRSFQLHCPDLPSPWHLLFGLLTWGAVSVGERKVWEAVIELGSATCDEVARQAEVAIDEVDVLLNALARRRLMMKLDDQWVAVGAPV